MRLRSLPLCPIYLEVSFSDRDDRTVGGFGLSVSVVGERSSVQLHWRETWDPRLSIREGWFDLSFLPCSLREAIRGAARAVSTGVREEDVSCFENQLLDPAGLALALSVMDS